MKHSNKEKTYIIGDIHGEYKTLLALITKLPQEAKLIFVGDLIDRGPQSKEVIAFVKERKAPCMLGNHEWMMLEYGRLFLDEYPHNSAESLDTMWLKHGGIETLISYGLLQESTWLKKWSIIHDKDKIAAFQADILWLDTLAYYHRFQGVKKEGKEIVISHASISDFWHLHNAPNEEHVLHEAALWNRNIPTQSTSIYNIHGHTPITEIACDTHSLNIDTGCYMREKGYGRLSAYCVEDESIISIDRVS